MVVSKLYLLFNRGGPLIKHSILQKPKSKQKVFQPEIGYKWYLKRYLLGDFESIHWNFEDEQSLKLLNTCLWLYRFTARGWFWHRSPLPPWAVCNAVHFFIICTAGVGV